MCYNARMIHKQWKIAAAAPAGFRAAFPDISPVTLQLLWNRGLRTPARVDEFLNPDYGANLHDAFQFSAMERAVERILSAVVAREPMVVYGDYDADGVCAAALLVSALESLGATPGVYLPFRETEGYGVNRGAAAEIIQHGYRLVVTVDCGITNAEEIGTLQAAGVDVIVTDHHTPPDNLPPAVAILNPKLANETYPYPHLSAAGIAFKLASALFAAATRARHPDVAFPPSGSEKWLLDLVAISTIADMCELVGENRTLVYYGLSVLRKTRRIGLRALVEVAGLELSTVDAQAIGFALAPRINAAGRMNHASAAYLLLMSGDAERAKKLAHELDEQNRRRQHLTEEIRQAARAQVTPVDGNPLLFAAGATWSPGLVGLVAGRLADEFQRPAVVVGGGPDGALIGSGRSVPGFNITEALRECPEYLTRFGGHAAACGFTVRDVSDLPRLQARLQELARAALGDRPAVMELAVEAEIDPREVNFALLEQLKQFEPFGPGNPRPRLVARNLTVSSAQPVGTNGRHLRLLVSQRGHPDVLKLIGFSLLDKIPPVQAGDVVDAVFEAGENHWNGNRELQLKIVDLQQTNLKDADQHADHQISPSLHGRGQGG